MSTGSTVNTSDSILAASAAPATCYPMAIPAELRIHVYEYVASTVPVFHIEFGKATVSEHQDTAGALARTSKEVRQEVLPVFRDYAAKATINFEVQVARFDFVDLMDFMKTVPPHKAERERKIHIELT
jgi:hypothetical protein